MTRPVRSVGKREEPEVNERRKWVQTATKEVFNMWSNGETDGRSLEGPWYQSKEGKSAKIHGYVIQGEQNE